jgi:hypothetical protein
MNSQIILIALFFAVLPLTSAQSQDKKPNILVIFPDDVGWQNISAYPPAQKAATFDFSELMKQLQSGKQ